MNQRHYGTSTQVPWRSGIFWGRKWSQRTAGNGRTHLWILYTLNHQVSLDVPVPDLNGLDVCTPLMLYWNLRPSVTVLWRPESTCAWSQVQHRALTEGFGKPLGLFALCLWAPKSSGCYIGGRDSSSSCFFLELLLPSCTQPNKVFLGLCSSHPLSLPDCSFHHTVLRLLLGSEDPPGTAPGLGLGLSIPKPTISLVHTHGRRLAPGVRATWLDSLH